MSDQPNAAEMSASRSSAGSLEAPSCRGLAADAVARGAGGRGRFGRGRQRGPAADSGPVATARGPAVGGPFPSRLARRSGRRRRAIRRRIGRRPEAGLSRRPASRPARWPRARRRTGSRRPAGTLRISDRRRPSSWAPAIWPSPIRPTIRPKRSCTASCAGPARPGWPACRGCDRWAERSAWFVRCWRSAARSCATILQALGQDWREDATNARTDATRNWIRNEMLPAAAERVNPGGGRCAGAVGQPGRRNAIAAWPLGRRAARAGDSPLARRRLCVPVRRFCRASRVYLVRERSSWPAPRGLAGTSDGSGRVGGLGRIGARHRRGGTATARFSRRYSRPPPRRAAGVGAGRPGGPIYARPVRLPASILSDENRGLARCKG